MKKAGWIILLLWSVGSVWAAEPRIFTLADAVEYGRKHSPLILEADYQTIGADYELKSVRGNFLPKLSAGYARTRISSIDAEGPSDDDYLDQNNTSFNIRLSQILYAGSSLFNDYQRAEAQKQMYQASKKMVLVELTYNIETAFFKLMKAKGDVAAAKDTVKRLESEMTAVQAYFDREMVPYVQVLEAKSELFSARSAFVVAGNKVEKERASLMSILNMPVSENITFQGSLDYYPPDYSVAYETVWELALKTRPDLEMLEQQKIMARKKAAIEGARYYPTVRMEAGYYDSKRDYDSLGTSFTGPYDRDQSNSYWQGGVSIQWELFDGGRAWFSRQKHLTEIKVLEQKILSLENSIQMHLEQAVLSIPEASTRIRITQEAIQAGKENYLGEKMRLAKGVSTIPAVLDAQARLTRLQAEHNNALFDYQLAMASLSYLLGTRQLVELNQK